MSSRRIQKLLQAHFSSNYNFTHIYQRTILKNKKNDKETNYIAAFNQHMQMRNHIAISCQKDCSVADYLF